MKLKHLFLTLIAGATALVSCDLLEEFGFNEEDLGLAELSVDLTELSLPKEESTATIALVATRDWIVSGELPEWLTLSATSGEASKKPQSITVTVLENKGNDREATIGFTIGTKKVSVSVKQAGALGEVVKGSGTKEDPYTVAGAIEYINTLTGDSPIKVYIKGKVCKLGEDGKDEVGFTTQYGNGTFRMSDDGANENSFYAYRINYLGNKKFTASDTDVKVGDEVIVYGNVVNYKGNTPETVSGTAFLFSLNGVDKGGDEAQSTTTAEAKGTGTEADPFNVAAAIAKAQATGQTATSEAYYIKGKVKSVSEQFSAQYGNGTFVLVDEGFDAVFTAFRILYFGNKKWAEGDKTVSEGDEIVVVGKIVNFKGNTPETEQGSAYLYSLNGEKGDATPPAEETKADPAGDGTEANPFNVSAAIDKAKEVGKTATEQDYYVKGKVAKITEQFGAQYGNGTFVLVDEGFTAVFTAYRILYLGGEKWVEGDATVAVGDELVVVGKIVNYNDATPEITQGGHLYSLNGQTSIEQSPVFGVQNTDIKVSATATSATIKVTGNVAWVAESRECELMGSTGTGAGEVTATFAINNTDAPIVYNVVIKTEADVQVKAINVTITQAKAGSSGEQFEVQWLEADLAAAKDKGAVNQMNDVISFTNSSSYSGSVGQLRIYKGQTLTVTAAEGYTLTEVSVICTAEGDAQYGPGCFTCNPEGYSYTGKQGMWIGEAQQVALTASTNQVRIVDLKIHYKAN